MSLCRKCGPALLSSSSSSSRLSLSLPLLFQFISSWKKRLNHSKNFLPYDQSQVRCSRCLFRHLSALCESKDKYSVKVIVTVFFFLWGGGGVNRDEGRVSIKKGLWYQFSIKNSNTKWKSSSTSKVRSRSYSRGSESQSELPVGK